jgi:catechol 2,3-dioxygenase-like lactoylglutathione lyase family enzyme
MAVTKRKPSSRARRPRASKPAPRRPSARAKRPATPARGRAAKPRARRAAPARPAAKSGVRRTRRRDVRAVGGGPPGFLGLHLAYTSPDLESVRRFWVDALGFAEDVTPQPLPHVRVHAGADAGLAFGPPENGPPERWRPPREPLVVIEVADVEQAHRALVARGAAFEHAPVEAPGGVRLAFLRDPDGRLVALIQTLAARP